MLVVDDCTDYCWSFFLKRKDDQCEILLQLFQETRNVGHLVKKIRCDNAGENIKFQKECVLKGWNVTFEFTSPSTPQQNGRVERKFATIYNSLRASLADNPNLRNKLWCEAADHATDVENLLIRKKRNVPPAVSFFGKHDQRWKFR